MNLKHFKFGFRGSRQGSVIYTTVPKAGCSTIQLTLANEYARVSGLRPLQNPHNPLKKEYFILFNDPARSPLEELLDTRLLFSIVRNPYSRLLSAYLDKIHGRAKEYQGLLASHGLASDRDISFSDFVHLVAEESFHQMDQHWAPQRGILSWDIFRYGYLGFQESLSEDLVVALNGRGLDTKTPDNYAAHSRSASNKLREFYTEDLRRIVYQIYKGDFEAFGYSEDIDIATADRSVSAAGRDRSHNIKPEYQGLIAAHDALGRRDIRQAAVSLDLWLPEAEKKQIVDIDDYQFAGQLYLRTHRFKEAEQMLEKALAARPNRTHVLVALARCAAKAGDLQKAHGFVGRVEQTARPGTPAAKFASTYRAKSAKQSALASARRGRAAPSRTPEDASLSRPPASPASIPAEGNAWATAGDGVPTSDNTRIRFAGRVSRVILKTPREIRTIEGIESAPLLFENAEKIADQVVIPRQTLDFLYDRSRWIALPRGEWEREIRTACAIDQLLSMFHRRTSFESFEAIIDQQAKADFSRFVTGSGPMLILTFHGAFPIIARKLFSTLVTNGEMLGRGGTIPAGADFRSALFTALRAIQAGRTLWIAPDGPEGTLDAILDVFGTKSPGGKGAAFLAHTSNCRTAWLAVTRQGHHFVPVIAPGPMRASDESFDDFSARFFRFYCDQIEATFTGDPRNISLRARWSKLFSSREL